MELRYLDDASEMYDFEQEQFNFAEICRVLPDEAILLLSVREYSVNHVLIFGDKNDSKTRAFTTLWWIREVSTGAQIVGSAWWADEEERAQHSRATEKLGTNRMLLVYFSGKTVEARCVASRADGKHYTIAMESED